MKNQLEGQRFGRLMVLSREGTKGKTVIWRCRCDCGNTCVVRTHHLKQPEGVRSCGCLKKSLSQGPQIICRSCGRGQPKSNFFRKGRGTETRHNICKDCMRPIYSKAKKSRNFRDKQLALEQYGGKPPKCACCGEKHLEFLTIDHVKGGGTAHRRSIGSGSGAFFRWLRNEGWPKGFRVLCMNCNFSFGLFGFCPHQKGEI